LSNITKYNKAIKTARSIMVRQLSRNLLFLQKDYIKHIM